MARALLGTLWLLAALPLLGAGCKPAASETRPDAAVPSGRAAPRIRLRIADQAGLSKSALSMAGELTTTPYDIEWSSFAAGPPLLEALGADAIDLGAVGDSPPVFAQAGGAPIVIVAVLRNSPKYEALLVPAASPLREVRELRGKKVAVAKGSGAHHLLLAALSRAGLGINDIQPVYLTPNDAQPAFSSGDVDAWSVWDPFAVNNLRMGARKLTDGEGLIPGLGFQVTSQKALANPEKSAALADYLQRARRAQTFTNSHRAEWAQTYAELTKLDREVAKDMFAYYAPVYVPLDARVIADHQRLADMYLAAGLIPRPLQVAGVFDARFDALINPR
jgi:sulfonate transport system substrate-binding protein